MLSRRKQQLGQTASEMAAPWSPAVSVRTIRRSVKSYKLEIPQMLVRLFNFSALVTFDM